MEFIAYIFIAYYYNNINNIYIDFKNQLDINDFQNRIINRY